MNSVQSRLPSEDITIIKHNVVVVECGPASVAQSPNSRLISDKTLPTPVFLIMMFRESPSAQLPLLEPLIFNAENQAINDHATVTIPDFVLVANKSWVDVNTPRLPLEC